VFDGLQPGRLPDLVIAELKGRDMVWASRRSHDI
jgi:hypothetical protein